MDFDRATADVQQWLESSPNSANSFRLSSVEQEKRKLNFLLTDGATFYIIVDDGGEGNSWSIWSEDADIQTHLIPANELLDQKKNKSIIDVLQCIQKSMSKEGKGNDYHSNREDEINDEEVEGCVDSDYYRSEDEDYSLQSYLPAAGAGGSDSQTASNFFNARGDVMAVQRLGLDLKNVQGMANYGIEAHPVNDNLFIWTAKLKDFPPESKLADDLRVYAKRYQTEPVIHMEIQFPGDYPFSPPFLRVTKPRFKFMTGHITVGGSVCMQMLTKSGWVAANDLEAILVSVRSEIISDENARLDLQDANNQYTEQEAREAFQRMVYKYKW